ncbi:MAG: preprotein translocase subunit SecA [Thermomicrobia bacterium]|nr:preprotein translocase subunit SecA [Thermomicrobia bacterium]MCA1722791.1 preprotein translocase subunit SecA [Thermomicrobia bacterium]
MFKFLGKIFDNNEKAIRAYMPRVTRINDLEPAMKAKSDDELRAVTEELTARLEEGETLDDVLPEAFAAVREASRRVNGMRHFDVQLIGGIVLHEGKIAEMKTGEGKTLVATLPLYLNALTGEGCHLITVNDYLVRRDGRWMGAIYHFLGLSVGIIQHERAFLYDPAFESEDESYAQLRPVPRPEAYAADITYGTNNEFGFDYLRDNMVFRPDEMAQRPLVFGIVDEVDNILIDEARTPLIISGDAQEATDHYDQFARIARTLKRERDYTIDEKTRSASLTDEGIDCVEEQAGIPAGESIYDERYADLTHYMENALKAQAVYQRDKDYIVRDGEVVIVDEFTGRLMDGRRYSEGLHQAIEAKEGVHVKRENRTLATITFQNYFRMYEKLAGMTGTAATEAEEFYKIYKLEVVTIPTNKEMVRQDQGDFIFKTEEAKFKAVAAEIKERQEKGQPVLVGTVSVEKSEYLSELLTREGVSHFVLNAKYHEREAEIIVNAGDQAAVTIATNMAGRGTDIKLGEGVRELGGLHIIGTERHEARRIDNQLRGRAGRQGDPGSSRFYVSLEDDLMRRFGSERIAGMMDKLGVDDDTPIEAGLISRSIESAQTKVEGYNFDLRKHVVEYDDVVNKQREKIYEDRAKIVRGENMRDAVLDALQTEIERAVETHSGSNEQDYDVEGLIKALSVIIPLPPDFDPDTRDLDILKEDLVAMMEEAYTAKEAELGDDNMRQLERLVMLRVIDTLWVEYLTSIEDLRIGIGLQAYGQRDPLVSFKTEGYRMFQQLQRNILHDIAHTIFQVTLVQQVPEANVFANATTNREDDEGGGKAKRAKAGATSNGKVGRNAPCPLGSGKKVKQCCGACGLTNGCDGRGVAKFGVRAAETALT